MATNLSAAGLLCLAAVTVVSGTASLESTKVDSGKPNSWYPEGEGDREWPAKCRDQTASPRKGEIKVTTDMKADKDIFVTKGKLNSDELKWIVESVWSGDCSKADDCKRATVLVKSDASNKLVEVHSVKHGDAVYHYDKSEFHMPAEHEIKGAEAELRMRFKKADADAWLAISVGFKKDAEETPKNEFLEQLVKTLSGDQTTSTSTTTKKAQTLSSENEGKTENSLNKKANPAEFAKLDVFKTLEKAMEKEAVIYEGAETHPPCNPQKMVVAPDVIKVPKTQWTELAQWMGTSNWSNTRAKQDNKSPLMKVTLKAAESGNTGATLSPKIPFVVAGSLLTVTAVAAM